MKAQACLNTSTLWCLTSFTFCEIQNLNGTLCGTATQVCATKVVVLFDMPAAIYGCQYFSVSLLSRIQIWEQTSTKLLRGSTCQQSFGRGKEFTCVKKSNLSTFPWFIPWQKISLSCRVPDSRVLCSAIYLGPCRSRVHFWKKAVWSGN